MDAFSENKESTLNLQKEFCKRFNSLGVETFVGFIDKNNNEFEF